MPKSTLHRVGSVCLIAGALVTGAASGIHPPPAEPAAMVQVEAAAAAWIPIHWALMLGLVAMQIGFTAFMLTLRDPAEKRDAGGWGLMAIYVLMIGLGLWIGEFAIGAATKPLADAVQSDPILLGGARALIQLGDSFEIAAITVYWIGIALLGIAVLVSERYPHWMGAVGVLLGAGMSLGVGLVRAFAGQSPWTRAGLSILSVASLLWAIGLGVLLWRRAGSPRQARV